MGFKQLLELFLYLGLLFGGLFFCWHNVKEYMKGATGYSVTTEYITVIYQR